VSPDAGNTRLPPKEGGALAKDKSKNMNLKNAVLALAVVAFVGFVGSSFADDTKVAGKKSLETRIAELEAKLKTRALVAESRAPESRSAATWTRRTW